MVRQIGDPFLGGQVPLGALRGGQDEDVGSPKRSGRGERWLWRVLRGRADDRTLAMYLDTITHGAEGRVLVMKDK